MTHSPSSSPVFLSNRRTQASRLELKVHWPSWLKHTHVIGPAIRTHTPTSQRPSLIPSQTCQIVSTLTAKVVRVQLAHPQIVAPHLAVHRTGMHRAIHFHKFNTPTQLSIIHSRFTCRLDHLPFFAARGKIKTTVCSAYSEVYTECLLYVTIETMSPLAISLVLTQSAPRVEALSGCWCHLALHPESESAPSFWTECPSSVLCYL